MVRLQGGTTAGPRLNTTLHDSRLGLNFLVFSAGPVLKRERPCKSAYITCEQAKNHN